MFNIFLRKAQQRCAGVDPDQLFYPARIIIRQVEPGTDADLHHDAVRTGHKFFALLGKRAHTTNGVHTPG